MKLYFHFTIYVLVVGIFVCCHSIPDEQHDLKKIIHRRDSISKNQDSMRQPRSISSAHSGRSTRSLEIADNIQGSIEIKLHESPQEMSDKVTAEADKLVLPGTNTIEVVLLKRQEVNEGLQNNLDFYVDRSMYSLLIEFRGKCGKQIQIINEREQYFNFTIDTENYSRQISTDQPEDTRGLWSLVVIGGLQCNIEIYSRSTMGFVMTLKTKNPNQDESAFKILNNNPSKHKALEIVLDGFGLEMLTSGAKDQPTFVRFLNIYGNDVIDSKNITIDNINGIDSSSRVILNNGLQTDSPVYVVVEGRDFNGNKFSRMMKEPIKTSHVALKNDLGDNIIIPLLVDTTINITIKNHGLNDTFAIDLKEENNFGLTTTYFLPEHNDWNPILINSKESKVYPLSIRIPDYEQPGQIIQVTFQVNGTRPGSLQYITFHVIAGTPNLPTINSLVVKGTINSRFAETVMTSTMTNNADVGLEAKFDVMLPIDAFITNLTMKRDNVTIIGKVEEKQKAKKIYEEAKKRGKATGHVEARESSTRFFKTSLFVEAGKNITFKLTYQQLLRKGRDGYKYTVVLNPNQFVKNLQIVVHIVEENVLKFVKIPYFDTGINGVLHSNLPAGTSISFGHERKSSHIRYSPSIAQQTLLSSFGLFGTFAVEYDVITTHLYGDITVADGYFFHFFTPPQREEVLPKRVIFIIDISGSMSGSKMQQVKDGLSTILRSLNQEDMFYIVYFNHEAKSRNGTLLPATTFNIRKEIEYLKTVTSGGGTRFIPAFRVAFSVISKQLNRLTNEDEAISEENLLTDEMSGDYIETSGWGIDEEYDNMIVFLTDGDGSDAYPNDKITKMNRGRMKIHTIAFGAGANEKVLREVAAFNEGTYRKIYDSVIAPVQIQDFFNEITTTNFENVSIKYPVNHITDVTGIEFDSVKPKSDIVWGGKFRDDADLLDVGDDFDTEESFNPNVPPQTLTAQLSGRYKDEIIEFDIPINTETSSNIKKSHHQIKDFSERLWAFLRIKGLLKEMAITKNKTEKIQLKEKALNMSLSYNFVTPLTSMVVIPPEESKKIEEALKKQAEEEEKRRIEEEERLITLLAKNKKTLLKNTNLVMDSPSNRGSFNGDPHFVIPINPHFNLCFNWDGKDKEIYNLLHSSSTGMTINAQLITISAPEDSGRLHRTYVGALAVLLPRIGYKLIIRPENISLFSPSMKEFTFPVTSSLTIHKSEISLRVFDVTHKVSKIILSVEDWEFHIFLHRNNQHLHQVNHLDFYMNINKSHLVSPLSGVIGQFVNADVTLIEKNNINEETVLINNRLGRVSRHRQKLPGSRDEVTCWYSRQNARDFIQVTHERYLVEGMMTVPMF